MPGLTINFNPKVGGASTIWGLMTHFALAAVMALLWNLALNSPLYLYPESPGWQRAAYGLALTVVISTPLFAALLLTRTGILTVGAVSVAAAGVSIANAIKLKLRAEPILPTDLAFISESPRVAGFVSTGPGRMELISIGVATILGLLLCAYSWRRRVQLSLASSVLVSSLALLAGLGLFQFAQGEGPLVRAFALGGKGAPTEAPVLLYEQYGLLLGALALSTPGEPVTSHNPSFFMSVNEAQRFLTETGGGVGQAGDKRSSDQPNVVVVLSEGLTDPSVLPDITVPEDLFEPLEPHLRTGAVASLRAVGYGGGTGDVEFQVLTGLPLSALSDSGKPAFVRTVSQLEEFSSFTETFSSQGYRTLAIHPYIPSFYNRKTAYAAMGFDAVQFEDSFVADAARNGVGYVLDSEVYDRAYQELAATSEPAFVNVVTMQNHTPWEGAWTTEEEVGGLMGAHRTQLAQYTHGIRRTVEATADFLLELGRLDERTIVVVYGDHLPGLYPSDTREAAGALAFQTPLWIFDSGADLGGVELGELSPAQTLPMALRLSGQPLPPIAAALARLRDPTVQLVNGEDAAQARKDAQIAEALWWLTKAQMDGQDIGVSYEVPSLNY